MKLFHESTLRLPARTTGERYLLYLLESNEKQLGFSIFLRVILGSAFILYGWISRDHAFGYVFAFFGFVYIAGIVRLWKDSVLVRMIRRLDGEAERGVTEQCAAPNGGSASRHETRTTDDPPSVR